MYAQETIAPSVLHPDYWWFAKLTFVLARTENHGVDRAEAVDGAFWHGRGGCGRSVPFLSSLVCVCVCVCVCSWVCVRVLCVRVCEHVSISLCQYSYAWVRACEREMRKISLAYQTLHIHVYAGKRSKANKQKHLFLMENRRPLRYSTLFMHLLHKHYAHFAPHIAR